MSSIIGYIKSNNTTIVRANIIEYEENDSTLLNTQRKTTQYQILNSYDMDNNPVDNVEKTLVSEPNVYFRSFDEAVIYDLKEKCCIRKFYFQDPSQTFVNKIYFDANGSIIRAFSCSIHEDGSEQKQGIYYEFYPNGLIGSMKRRCTYNNDKLHGHYEEYYPTGSKRFECTFIHGAISGKTVEYHDSCQTSVKNYYLFDKNRIMEESSYSLSGDLIHCLKREFETVHMNIIMKCYRNGTQQKYVDGGWTGSYTKVNNRDLCYAGLDKD